MRCNLEFQNGLYDQNKLQWSTGVVNLISSVWRLLTLEKYSSRPLVQLGLSEIQSKVNCQTINYYITVNMQKHSSIHQLILETQHKYFAHFWIMPAQKNLEVSFTCPEFVLTFEKSLHSFYLFFRYSQCWSPVSQAHFTIPTQKFSINFQFL